MPGPLRKIIHIDMDAFYAAIEQRDNPAYRQRPIIVGGRPHSRGVVATCSYEARRFGIHSAMPSAKAYQLCPQAIFVKPRFDIYRETSQQIRNIFAHYCDRIEPLALDEAYLDVSNSNWFQGSASLLAKQIKDEIFQQTGLTASAGVSYNKFLAKLASEHRKPDGLFLIPPEQGEAYVAQLAIEKFHGIGPATANKMHQLGVHNGSQLKQLSLELLQQHFGKAAQQYYNIARGLDHRPVNAERTRKSIGSEVTFEHDISDRQVLIDHLQQLLRKCLNRLNETHQNAYTLTIKIKFDNFVQITRGRTLPQALRSDLETQPLLEELLHSATIEQRKIRLVGITLSGLEEHQPAAYRQLDLFELF